ncbi:MAG TPA: response regulator [Reyranella sp.]|nr:response regulator [Reyranella sp.]
MSRVLLAEDEFLIRAVLVDALGDVGIACIEAATGQKAIEVVTGSEPLTAIIVDIGLPDMSGEKVIEAAARHRPGVPVIRCSGSHDPVAGAPGQKIHVFSKPYSAEELARFVSGLARPGG